MPPTILIVDDVAKRRLHLKSMLLEREDAILEANSVEAALELIRRAAKLGSVKAQGKLEELDEDPLR